MKHGPNTGDTALDRREFIRMALMSSALMAATSEFAEGETDFAASYHGAMRFIAPGAIQPEGWLRQYMEKQATQLALNLPKISYPFNRDYWNGLDYDESTGFQWWPWEQKAYWIDGATRLALALKDEQLWAQVRSSIDYTLNHADGDGFLGPKYLKSPTVDDHRWPHTVIFRSFAAIGDAQSQLALPAAATIAEEMRQHYVNDTASYSKPIRNVTNVEGMLWCYSHTGDARLLAMAEKAWQENMKLAADPEHGDMTALRVFADTPIIAHGVTYAELVKLPAILYLYTGKDDYLKFALAAQRRIFDNHMLIDGIPSTSEEFRAVTSLDAHETCDIADHTWSWGYMLAATGDSKWADRIERACFNAAPGAIKNDWKAVQYFSCPNQFLATLTSNHCMEKYGNGWMAYQPNPGEDTACCGGNVHRVIPNYAIRMWAKTTDGGLAAVLYGPSKLVTTAGAEGRQVEIVQTTNYPFDEDIHFAISAGAPVTFPLSLRIPGWCDEPRVIVNGKTVFSRRSDKGFLILRREFNPGDQITLTLPMKVAVTRWPENGVGIERGPLVYSLPIKEDWKSFVRPKYSSEEFPGWEATAASAWNYGIALSGSDLASEIKVEKRPEASGQLDDPWTTPPISLSVAARKIEGWELLANPDNPEQKFTPCLPELSATKVSDKVERLTLVPYGSTQLRVTIFPAVPDKREG
jgi:uncharacterized protein